MTVFVTDLEIAAASYERQVDELVAEDDETADYVHDPRPHGTQTTRSMNSTMIPNCSSPRSRSSSATSTDAIGRGMLSRSSVVRASDRERLFDPGDHLIDDLQPDRLIQDLVTEPIEDRSLR